MVRNKARVTQLERRAQLHKKDFVTFFYDYEHECLYDKPFDTQGARMVSPEQLAAAQETKTVILVEYVKKPLPGEGGENGK